MSTNSNGAAYNPEKHAVLNEYIDTFGLHCESLIPETYDYLMQPLRLERVQAKFEMIFRDFPNKVHVSTPVSRRNLHERERIREYFTALGASNVVFNPLANRCTQDDTLFDNLAFAPHKIACKPDIFYNLIIDSDGTVLACCNDFQRVEPIGNLSTDSLAETLSHPKRMAMRQKLADGAHADLSTCSRCRADVPESIPPMTDITAT